MLSRRLQQHLLPSCQGLSLIRHCNLTFFCTSSLHLHKSLLGKRTASLNCVHEMWWMSVVLWVCWEVVEVALWTVCGIIPDEWEDLGSEGTTSRSLLHIRCCSRWLLYIICIFYFCALCCSSSQFLIVSSVWTGAIVMTQTSEFLIWSHFGLSWWESLWNHIKTQYAMMSFKEGESWVTKPTCSIPLIISLSDTRQGKSNQGFS